MKVMKVTALLFRIGTEWWVDAPNRIGQGFPTARKAREWAKANKVSIKRAADCDRKKD